MGFGLNWPLSFEIWEAVAGLGFGICLPYIYILFFLFREREKRKIAMWGFAAATTYPRSSVWRIHPSELITRLIGTFQMFNTPNLLVPGSRSSKWANFTLNNGDRHYHSKDISIVFHLLLLYLFYLIVATTITKRRTVFLILFFYKFSVPWVSL